MKVEDVIIIGGGPSGIACGVQLARCGIKPVILEKGKLGGLLVNANYIENYPGFPKGISGNKFAELLKDQIKKYKIKVIFEEVFDLILEGEFFKITTKKHSFHSKFLVIASGTKPKEFKDCPIPPELKDKIFYEVSPIRSVRNKKVVIVGAGDVAFDYALSLKTYNEVLILNRKEKEKCLPTLFKKIQKSKRINYKKNIKIKKIIPSSNHLIKLECKSKEGKINIEANYLLFAIGRKPCLDFLKEKIENNKIYLVGDVRNGPFRQIGIAIGDGIKTAMKIFRKIQGEEK
ncbi:MAG: NAD(P)/FAD-dependent oxidoreductase [candidate division WOR-3 bacterium]